MRIDTVRLVNKRKRGELVISDIMIKPIWSDSMGAKSFSLFIDTGDARILIDPQQTLVREALQELRPRLILGRSIDREVSMYVEDYNPWHVSITYPITDRFILNRSYIGFNGAITLVEDIHNSLGGLF